MEAEQVVNALRARGRAAGAVIRMTNIQPLNDVTNGAVWVEATTTGGFFARSMASRPMEPATAFRR
jgi:hypothetical protein